MGAPIPGRAPLVAGGCVPVRVPRLLWFAAACFSNVACAGVVFGFVSMAQILQGLGAFRELCDPSSDPSSPCQAQTLALNEVYNIASIVSFAAPLPIGFFLDRYGPRRTMLLTLAIFTLGPALSIVATTLRSSNIYYAAFVCFGASASAMLMPLYQICNLFERREGLALGVLNGSFDAGSLVFMLMGRMLSAGVPFVTIMAAYLAGPVAVAWLFAVFLWRDAPFPPAGAPKAAPSTATATALLDSPADGGMGLSSPPPLDAATGAASLPRTSVSSSSFRSPLGSAAAAASAVRSALSTTAAGDAEHGAETDVETDDEDGDEADDEEGGEAGGRAVGPLTPLVGSASTAARHPHDGAFRLGPAPSALPSSTALRPVESSRDAAATDTVAAGTSVSEPFDSPAATGTQLGATPSVDTALIAASSRMSPTPSGRPLPAVRSSVRFQSGSGDEAAAAGAAAQPAPPPVRPAAALPLEAARLHALPFRAQLLSREWLAFCAFFSVCILRFDFTLGSIDTQLNSLGQANEEYTQIFGIILPLGFFSQFLIGPLIDRAGIAWGVTALWGLGVLFSAASLVPSLQVQAANFVVFACFRGFVFTCMANYMRLTFGFAHFGKLVGCVVLTGGLVGLLQTPLLLWALAGRGASGDFVPPNALVLALMGVAGVFPLTLLHRSGGGAGRLPGGAPPPEGRKQFRSRRSVL